MASPVLPYRYLVLEHNRCKVISRETVDAHQGQTGYFHVSLLLHLFCESPGVLLTAVPHLVICVRM
jgi:hypothetical protein